MNNLKEYSEMVQSVTSKPSNEIDVMIERLKELKKNNTNLNISLFLTGAIGLSCESGEILEIAKKTVFQGKEMSEQTLFHIKRELGDVFWYFMNTLRSLNLTLDDVIIENKNKLENRYPGKEFSVQHSEHRKENDL
jgi:NTP pyrophosphatase (non-canonical NTP hydrolase)